MLAMKCDKARKLFSRRLDGGLTPEDDAGLTNHLRGCAACSAYAADLVKLNLGDFDVPGPSPGFAATVMARVDESIRQRPVIFSVAAYFRPIAASLGLAASIAGFAVGSGLRPATTQESPSEPAVEQIASNALDPLAEESIETVLIAMLSESEE